MKKVRINEISFIICFCCLCGIVTFLKAQDTMWSRRFDLDLEEDAIDSERDIFDNIIIVGSAKPTSSSDILLLKYNQSGDLLWHKIFDAGQTDWGFCIVLDFSGNIIVGSYHDDLTTTKPGLTKFSPNGDTVWARIYPQFIDFAFDGITIDTQNNIYACGWNWGGTTSNSAIIVKCDSSGNVLWHRFYNWQLDPAFTDIITDLANNIVVTGFLGLSVLMVGKFNATGDSLWTRRYPLSGYSSGSSVKFDQHNNIVISGAVGDGVSYDAVVVKYSSIGDMLWNRVLNYRVFDSFRRLYIDQNNNIICCGSSGTTWLRNVDYMLVKLSPAGETLWTRFYDAGYNDYGTAVIVDSFNNPIITGLSFNGSTDDVLTIKYRGTTGIEEFVNNSNISRQNHKAKLFSITSIGREINLDINYSSIYKISLINSTGALVKVIHQGFLCQGLHQFSLKSVRSGVYFLQIENQAGKSCHKIILFN